MPDNFGKLSTEEREQAKKWIDKQAPDLVCPVCGKGTWMLGDHVIGLTPYSMGLIFGGTSYPAILVVCGECGLFRLFSAVMAGVVQSTTEQDAAKEGATNG